MDWRPTERTTEYSKLLTACRQSSETAVIESPGAGAPQERAISLGHTDAVLGVAWSPDGRLALSGSDDKTVRLWEVETGRAVSVLEGHTGGINSVAWSPDARLALSGSDDGTVRLWEVETGRALHVLEGHTANVLSVTFSPDGRLGMSGSADRTIRVWDVEAGRVLRVLEGHTSWVRSLAWSPDGRLALSAAGDMRVWEVDTGRVVRVIEEHSVRVLSVAWSPDGRLALSGSDDGTLRLWDMEEGRAVRTLAGHTDSVWSVAWSPNGRLALSGSNDRTIRLWEVETGRQVRVLNGHGARVRSVAFSLDGRLGLSGSDDKTVGLWEMETGRAVRVTEGSTGFVLSVAWSPDGRIALSGSADGTVRLWELETGRTVRVLEGHTKSVVSVAWSPDGRLALSGSADRTLRLWEVETGRALRVLESQTDSIGSVVFSPDGRLALSASGDAWAWDVETGRVVRVLEGQGRNITSVALSPNGRLALSAAGDIRLWDVETGRPVRMLEGHEGLINSVAWSPDGRLALSGSADRTLRLWDVETGRAVRVLEGHTGGINSVAWSPNGRLALSGSNDKTVRLWEVETGRAVRVLEGHAASVLSVAFSPDMRRAFSSGDNGVMRIWPLEIGENAEPRIAEEQIEYANAKVLLVGESGAGKTGLSMRLASGGWKASDSTLGAWATQWPMKSAGPEREIWLWDFGGQADQRLIHQLYMEDTAVAVLVFDGQKSDTFETIGQWQRDLTRASRKPFHKLLAAGRVDVGGPSVSRGELEKFALELGFTLPVFETSAKTGEGCEQLEQAILGAIDWGNAGWRTSPRLFKRLKDEIVRLKDSGRVLMRINDLREVILYRLAADGTQFTDEQFQAVLGLLASPGVLWQLEFGNWVLLQPEWINVYAQAMIQTMRTDPEERGCIPEDKVLRGDLSYPPTLKRLPAKDERFVLLAMNQTLVERCLCLREHTERGPLLIFPSYYRRERPELEGHPAVLVTYRFNGFLDEIYATLVVRLDHTQAFAREKLWRYAADFRTLTGKQLGVKAARGADASGELQVYADPAITVQEKIIFVRYVHEHLAQRAREVVRLRHYACGNCGRSVADREIAMEKLNVWLDGQQVALGAKRRARSAGGQKRPHVLCVKCEKRVALWDEIEQLFASPAVRQRVREMEEQSATRLDNESKERALVGEVISTVALAGQICRELSVSDHGIDIEIEFKHDNGEASGKKVYLVLDALDSSPRGSERGDRATFEIKDDSNPRYWLARALPVILVIRTDKQIEWIELYYVLRPPQVANRYLYSRGERFDVMSVRKWRDKALEGQR